MASTAAAVASAASSPYRLSSSPSTLHEASAMRNRRTSLLSVEELVIDGENPLKRIELLARLDSLHHDKGILKLNSMAVWLPRRLIATSEFLYILSSKGSASKYEIVDSVPMHEITAVRLMSPNVFRSKDDTVGKRQRSRKGPTETSLKSPPESSNEPRNCAEITSTAGVKGEETAADAPHMVPLGPLNALAHVPSKGKSNNFEGAHGVIRMLDPIQSPVEFSIPAQPRPHLPGFSATLSQEAINKVIDGVEIGSAFEILTQKDGFNQGKPYYFSSGSESNRDLWINALHDISSAARVAFRRKNTLALIQAWAKKIYQSWPFQISVILAITTNFALTLIQTQIGDAAQTCSLNSTLGNNVADSSLSPQVFDRLDLTFTILFAAGTQFSMSRFVCWGLPPAVTELGFNFCANAIRPFFRNKWNWYYPYRSPGFPGSGATQMR
jgi:hypothetical protein